jgi:hypothetical protein
MNETTMKTQPKKQDETFQRAIQAFKNTVALEAEFTMLAMEPAHTGALRPDRLIRITMKGKALEYYAEEKPNLTKADEFILKMYKEKLDKPILLVANYINPPMADRLKQTGIEFIDTAGNAYINNPAFYVFVKGNRPPDILKRQTPERAFKTAGLKMIFAFLCNPGLENKTYREIAAATGVALGTVNRIMKNLIEMGFLLDLGKRGCKLTQKEKLLQRWVTVYAEQLRPKLILGCYRGQVGWWTQKELNQWNAQWGGEIAAAQRTHYLKPEMITIYAPPDNLNQILLENRLKKDADGDVEILAKFWKPTKLTRKDEFVPPILVYADLLAAGNERDAETAKMIYEQDIVGLIRED